MASSSLEDEDDGEIGLTGKGKIRSLSRGIAILQAINRGGSLTMTDISTLSGVPYPTARRLVWSLIQDGMIEREAIRKRYRPTALVQTLSSGYQIENQLVLAARSYIVRLTEEFLWPVSITTRVGTSIMVRDSTHSLTPLTFNVYHPGYTLSMLESASGRAYLAFCSDHERNTVERGLKSMRDGPKLSAARWDSIHQQLQTYRDQGYATNWRLKSNQEPGKTSSISAPVFCRGHIVGTMTLTFFASAMSLEDAKSRFAAPIVQAAAALSAELDTDKFQILID